MKRKLTYLYFLLALPVSLTAQENDEAEPLEGEESAPVAQEEELSPSIEATMTETFGISYTDDSVRQIVRDVADIFELNIVMPDHFRGETSLRLRNVTWPQVFDIVLEEFGYTYRISNNIIFIERDVDEDVIDEEEEFVDPRVIRTDDDLLNLTFEDPTPIREVINLIAEVAEINLAPLPGSLTGDTQFRYRGVSWQEAFEDVLALATDEEGQAIPHTFIEDGRRVRVVVEREDRRALPITIFQIEHASADGLKPFIERAIDGNGRVDAEGRTNTLIVQTPSENLENIRSLLARLDQPVQQVLIESRFIEIRKDDQSNIGLDWQGLRGFELSAQSMSHGFERVVGQNTSDSEFGGDPRSARATEATFSASDFRLILNLLREQTNARVLTNPTITVINNETATIETEEFRFREGERTETETTAGFRTTFGAAQPLDVNPSIKLTVTPKISARDLITLSVEPEVSNLVDEQTFQSGEVIPIVRTRRAQTEVTIRDGQTLAIGGLVDSTDSDREVRVPLLGSIPAVGRLFRSSGRNIEESNLIIFLTASILDPYTANYTDFVDEQRMLELGLSHRDVQGFGYNRSDEEQALLEELARLRSVAEGQAVSDPLRQQVEALRRQFGEEESDAIREGRIIRDPQPAAAITEEETLQIEEQLAEEPLAPAPESEVEEAPAEEMVTEEEPLEEPVFEDTETHEETMETEAVEEDTTIQEEESAIVEEDAAAEEPVMEATEEEATEEEATEEEATEEEATEEEATEEEATEEEATEEEATEEEATEEEATEEEATEEEATLEEVSEEATDSGRSFYRGRNGKSRFR
ncbi:MAG: secretin and TonB N-terminal domain-containing protein [Opitutales bacterium]|nr:secretin and TonB N-terminal domain-containing protein [Opitutales bacterium]